MLKKELRLKYKALRKALSENDIESMSLEIANQALSLPIWDKTYFHIFLPLKKDTANSIRGILLINLIFYFSIVTSNIK